MRLTYIGATLGATIGATIGAGKRRCNMLIISGRCKRCHQTPVLHVYVRTRSTFNLHRTLRTLGNHGVGSRVLS